MRIVLYILWWCCVLIIGGLIWIDVGGHKEAFLGVLRGLTMETVLIVIVGLLYALWSLIAYLWWPILVVLAVWWLAPALVSAFKTIDDMRVIIADKRQQIDASKPPTDAERQRRAKLDAEIRAKMDAAVKRAQAERRTG
jgi:hypothetical protein